MRPSASGQDGRALYVTVKGARVFIVAAFMKKSQKAPKQPARRFQEARKLLGWRGDQDAEPIAYEGRGPKPSSATSTQWRSCSPATASSIMGSRTARLGRRPLRRHRMIPSSPTS